MNTVTVNIKRQEKVPARQSKAWEEFLEMLHECAAIEMKKGERKCSANLK